MEDCENGRITGILPLFLINLLFGGKKLISFPHTVKGGVCAESSEAEAALVKKAVQVTASLDADYLELRQFKEAHGGFINREEYFTFIVELS